MPSSTATQPPSLVVTPTQSPPTPPSPTEMQTPTESPSSPTLPAPTQNPPTPITPFVTQPTPPSSSVNLTIVGNNGDPADVFPLGRCQGDCGSDLKCQPGLVCYQRSYFESEVPGCIGNGTGSRDYCHQPDAADPPSPTETPTTPSPTTLLQQIGEVCNLDSDCETNQCFLSGVVGGDEPGACECNTDAHMRVAAEGEV